MASEDSLHILLFGDQTGDYGKIFRQLLHIKENTVLTSFFEKAYSALRDEVSQQPRVVRDQIPGFSSIADLVTRYAESTAPRSNPLESALTCISQIACFIWQVTQQRFSKSKQIDTNTTTAIKQVYLKNFLRRPTQGLLARARAYLQQQQ